MFIWRKLERQRVFKFSTTRIYQKSLFYYWMVYKIDFKAPTQTHQIIGQWKWHLTRFSLESGAEVERVDGLICHIGFWGEYKKL